MNAEDLIKHIQQLAERVAGLEQKIAEMEGHLSYAVSNVMEMEINGQR